MKEEIKKLKLEIKRLELLLRLKEENPPQPTSYMPPLHFHSWGPCYNNPCIT